LVRRQPGCSKPSSIHACYLRGPNSLFLQLSFIRRTRLLCHLSMNGRNCYASCWQNACMRYCPFFFAPTTRTTLWRHREFNFYVLLIVLSLSFPPLSLFKGSRCSILPISLYNRRLLFHLFWWVVTFLTERYFLSLKSPSARQLFLRMNCLPPPPLFVP